ncbi:hypothetical protein [Dyella kyungheensis]|uniref:DUF4124 domain-containing protein n=1 Tax=Dyella kyungheensis TaxID=1242174 RepID=A0ABS2JXR4_9GAMM|nr:hypothetical protein [Dyella kyungheensis]MBM7123669.1 hypothetical protein [Dyella kyungheensis]
MKRFHYGRCLAAAAVLSAALQTVYADTEKGNLRQPQRETTSLEKCGLIMKDDTGKSTLLPLPSLHVATTSESTPFTLPSDAPSGVTAVGCNRQSIVPKIYDYRVLKAGYPLYITGPAGRAAVALEAREGQVQIRVVRGDLRPDEATQIQESLDQIQSLFNNSSIAKHRP